MRLSYKSPYGELGFKGAEALIPKCKEARLRACAQLQVLRFSKNLSPSGTLRVRNAPFHMDLESIDHEIPQLQPNKSILGLTPGLCSNRSFIG